jgi:hypothetical protein
MARNINGLTIMSGVVPPGGGDFGGFATNFYEKYNSGNGKKENGKKGFVRKILKRFHYISIKLKVESIKS